MRVRKTAIVNRDYKPSDHDEQVIQVLKRGRANPLHIREETGLSKQRVNDALDRLRSAGWVLKVTRGLYELVEDPRDDAE
jgi:biotin operon repressor